VVKGGNGNHGGSCGDDDEGGRVSQPFPEPPVKPANGENAAAPWAMIWNQRVTFSAVTGSAATAAH